MGEQMVEAAMGRQIQRNSRIFIRCKSKESNKKIRSSDFFLDLCLGKRHVDSFFLKLCNNIPYLTLLTYLNCHLQSKRAALTLPGLLYTITFSRLPQNSKGCNIQHSSSYTKEPVIKKNMQLNRTADASDTSTQVNCAIPSALCSPCQLSWQGKGMDRILLSKLFRRPKFCQSQMYSLPAMQNGASTLQHVT